LVKYAFVAWLVLLWVRKLFQSSVDPLGGCSFRLLVACSTGFCNVIWLVGWLFGSLIFIVRWLVVPLIVPLVGLWIHAGRDGLV
jgi:hypothetical protein